MKGLRGVPQTSGKEKALILVKALPHVGKGHGEIVCCAGLTPEGEWRRQFPIRFRYLSGDRKFKRWQWVEYSWRKPKDDGRPESRRIEEDSIEPQTLMPVAQRARFLSPVIVDSTDVATSRGQTLALIRPTDVRFSWRQKTKTEVENERQTYAIAAKQLSFLDEELSALKPCPYEFRFDYRAAGAPHRHTCLDWETAATFYRRRKELGEERALTSMKKTFNEDYPSKGMVLALGTHSRRPAQWLLVGVLRLDEDYQVPLDLGVH